MADLATKAMQAPLRLAADYQCASDTRTHNHAKDRVVPLPGSIHGFRERRAFGIIGERHRAAEDIPAIIAHRFVFQAGNVGREDRALFVIDGTSYADANR